jgi:hypothetical protein
MAKKFNFNNLKKLNNPFIIAIGIFIILIIVVALYNSFNKKNRESFANPGSLYDAAVINSGECIDKDNNINSDDIKQLCINSNGCGSRNCCTYSAFGCLCSNYSPNREGCGDPPPIEPAVEAPAVQAPAAQHHAPVAAVQAPVTAVQAPVASVQSGFEAPDDNDSDDSDDEEFPVGMRAKTTFKAAKASKAPKAKKAKKAKPAAAPGKCQGGAIAKICREKGLTKKTNDFRDCMLNVGKYANGITRCINSN